MIFNKIHQQPKCFVCYFLATKTKKKTLRTTAIFQKIIRSIWSLFTHVALLYVVADFSTGREGMVENSKFKQDYVVTKYIFYSQMTPLGNCLTLFRTFGSTSLFWFHNYTVKPPVRRFSKRIDLQRDLFREEAQTRLLFGRLFIVRIFWVT